MVNTLAELATQFQVPISTLIVILLIALWDGVWKLIAMYKAARKRSIPWFIILAIFNTVGILPILYIFLFSELKLDSKPKKTKSKKKRR